MHKSFFVFILLIFVFVTARAQTNSFTYQGSLKDSGAAASGNYDMTVEIYDADTGGNLLGTANFTNVAVVNGVFTININATPSVFSGAARYLQLKVKRSGTTTLTTLSPRQLVTSAPYALKSQNAETSNNSLQLGGVSASQYVQTSDSRLSDARMPMAGSTDYIQNSTNPQTAGNFNISGNGVIGGNLTVNGTLNAVLSGNGAGLTTLNASNITTGTLDPARFAGSAILNSTTLQPSSNFNISGNGIVGSRFAVGGSDLTTWRMGVYDSSNNGFRVQTQTPGGTVASFGGFGAFRVDSQSNPGGRFSILENGKVGIGTSTPQYALHVIGQDVRVESNSTSVFPRFSWNFTGGEYNERKWQAYASVRALNFSALDESEGTENVWMQVKRRNLTNMESITFPALDMTMGIGTWTPAAKLHIADTYVNFFRPVTLRVTSDLTGGTIASFGEKGYFQVDSPGITGGRLNIYENGTVILGDGPGFFPGVTDRLVVNGTLRVVGLGSAGSLSLCRNTSNQIATCSSSIRYKQNIQDYKPGLDLVKKLRPVSFNWKADNKEDMGLVAEEVAAVEPLLTTQNEKGEVEGVKYDRVGVVLVNAVNEQQAQIEALQKENEELKARLEVLEKLIKEVKKEK